MADGGAKDANSSASERCGNVDKRQEVRPEKARKPRASLGRSERLIKTALFRQTFAQDRRWVGKYMVFWLRKGDDASLRLGVVSSRKVGKAVQRNRARRRLREAFRLHRHLFSADVDVVLVARRAIHAAPWPRLVEELLRLAHRAGVVKEDRS